MEINNVKIKIISFVMDESQPFEIDKCKSKHEDSVSVELALVSRSSVV